MYLFRYLGNKFNMAGSDEFQTAKCNEYIDAMVDVRTGKVSWIIMFVKTFGFASASTFKSWFYI